MCLLLLSLQPSSYAGETENVWTTLRCPIRTRWLALAMSAGLALLAAGCATPIGVKRISPQDANRALTANVLTTGEPGATAQEFLYRLNLSDKYREDPASTIAELHAGLGHVDESNRLFALAELSFDYAEHGGDRSYYLASAAYAWAFLFPENPAARPSCYDPRTRTAMDLYDRGVASGLASGKGDEVDLSARTVALPYGPLQLDVDPSGFRFGGYQLVRFTSLADFEVRGLRNRYRRRGIGAPLAASVSKSVQERVDKWIAPRAKVPVTALLRFDDPRRGMSNGALHGTIQLYDAEVQPEHRNRRRHRPAGVRNHNHAGLSARRGTRLGLRDRRLPQRRFQPCQARGQPVHAAPVSPRPHPGGLCARDGVEPGALGRDGQRVDERPGPRAALPVLVLHLQHRQPRPLLRHALARGAAARR